MSGKGSRTAGAAGGRELGGVQDVLTDEAEVAMRKGVSVRHHVSGPMDHRKVVAEQFLCPASDDVNLAAVVVQNFVHGAAMADPVKHGAPEIFLVFGNTSPTKEWKWRSCSVHFLESKRTGRRQVPLRVRSNSQMPSSVRRLVTATEAGLSSWRMAPK